MQLNYFQEKRKLTFRQLYNCDFPMQDLTIKTQIKKTNQEKFNNQWAMQNANINTLSKVNRLAIWFPKKMQKLREIAIPGFNIGEYQGIDGNYQWECSVCSTKFNSRLSDGKI